jgi:hypothetical protein
VGSPRCRWEVGGEWQEAKDGLSGVVVVVVVGEELCKLGGLFKIHFRLTLALRPS